MSARLSSVFPRPSASDPDDVVWTLQTAAVQWQRGLRADAIVWVRKAADLSTQGGRASRAEELRNHAARLAEYLWSDPEEAVAADSSEQSAQVPIGRRIISEEDEDEIIEVEELDSYELEFTETETELPTPEDAVARRSGPGGIQLHRLEERDAPPGLQEMHDLVERHGHQDDCADDHEGPVRIQAPEAWHPRLVDVGIAEHVDAVVDDPHHGRADHDAQHRALSTPQGAAPEHGSSDRIQLVGDAHLL